MNSLKGILRNGIKSEPAAAKFSIFFLINSISLE